MGYVTVKQAARMLQCSKARVRQLINRGKLIGHVESDSRASPYSGNTRWMIDRQSVEIAAQAAEEHDA